jgi:2-oxoisovalerate dehydrogenase E1 component subunit beta
MSELSLVQAVNAALKRAMSEDASVLVLGEDVGIDGGVFRATDGLFKEFGEQRVLDTPLAEASIAGVSIGLAAQGFRPVAEIQFTVSLLFIQQSNTNSFFFIFILNLSLLR